MPSLEWTVERVRGVTLVQLAVAADDRSVRVRIENRLDGPVWPPRRRGVPEAGWETDGVTVTLAAGETRALGYATPAAPVEPPAAIAAVESAPADDGGFEPAADVPAVEATPAGVVRGLGDPRPPRDAVPVDESSVPGSPGGTDDPAAGAAATGGTTARPPSSGASDPVDAWLAAVAGRIERVEALADADGLVAAGDHLAAVGGEEGAAALAERVGDDAAALRRIARRATALADRAEAADLPLAAYRGLTGRGRRP